MTNLGRMRVGMNSKQRNRRLDLDGMPTEPDESTNEIQSQINTYSMQFGCSIDDPLDRCLRRSCAAQLSTDAFLMSS